MECNFDQHDATGYKEERDVTFQRITSLEQQREPLQKEAERAVDLENELLAATAGALLSSSLLDTICRAVSFCKFNAPPRILVNIVSAEVGLIRENDPSNAFSCRSSVDLGLFAPWGWVCTLNTQR